MLKKISNVKSTYLDLLFLTRITTMNIKKHIPNLFTLGNLFCGLIALLFTFQSDFEAVAFFVVLGIVFDFFDGFLARILKVSGELGKQLDSLADMVTSGVVPGFVMYFLIYKSSYINIDKPLLDKGLLIQFSNNDYSMTWFAYLGLILSLAASYRLAKFNIDTRQSDSFTGLPTPAMSLFVVSLPLIQQYSDVEIVLELVSNNYFLIAIAILLSYLMNANLPLLALKFKSFSWKGNEFRFTLIALSIVLLITLQFLAIPLIIVVYILISIIQNLVSKKDEIQIN